MTVQVAHPERFAHESQETLWAGVDPIAYVVAGGIGLVGLLRVLTLPRHERPKRHRVFTIGMVAIGLVALVIFDLPIFVGGISDLSESLDGLLVYFLLPFGGAAWVLVKSWRYLFAPRAG